METMEQKNGEYIISTDKARLDISYIHRFLASSYWAGQIPIETVQRSIDGSLCFGMYKGVRQIGFARIISDMATFAYLADVFIDEAYRGQGLSKWLMKVILDYPGLSGFRRIMLATRDAHGLYAKFGFSPLTQADRWMQIHRPDVYRSE
jgi:GNAT superfamily N-acetyltransferase